VSPSKAQILSRERNYFIFRLRGIIPFLGQVSSSSLLDMEETDRLEEAFEFLKPLITKWDREKK
jgi:hypothetical protein